MNKEYICHYGIPGMKWGERKDPEYEKIQRNYRLGVVRDRYRIRRSEKKEKELVRSERRLAENQIRNQSRLEKYESNLARKDNLAALKEENQHNRELIKQKEKNVKNFLKDNSRKIAIGAVAAALFIKKFKNKGSVKASNIVKTNSNVKIKDIITPMGSSTTKISGSLGPGQMTRGAKFVKDFLTG